MKYYEDIKISPLPNNRYLLLEDFKYKDVIVPKGYITNGADVPRILWSIWPPNKSDYMPAVVLHDWLVDKRDFVRCHAYFKELMKDLEINKYTIWIFYNSTKLYLKFKYPQYKHV